MWMILNEFTNFCFWTLQLPSVGMICGVTYIGHLYVPRKYQHSSADTEAWNSHKNTNWCIIVFVLCLLLLLSFSSYIFFPSLVAPNLNIQMTNQQKLHCLLGLVSLTRADWLCYHSIDLTKLLLLLFISLFFAFLCNIKAISQASICVTSLVLRHIHIQQS